MPTGSVGFFTVDPATGKVTYTFRGVIYAQGLNLVAADDPATAPDSSRITWRWPTASSTNRAADIVSIREDAAPANSRLSLAASKPGGTLPFAAVNIVQMDAVNQANSAVTVGVDSAVDVATVIDGLSQSSFLQLLAVAKRKVAFGNQSFVWPGGVTSFVSSTPHGLGTGPLAVLICPSNAAVATDVVRTFNWDAANFGWQVLTNVAPPLNTNDSFAWVAIG